MEQINFALAKNILFPFLWIGLVSFCSVSLPKAAWCCGLHSKVLPDSESSSSRKYVAVEIKRAALPLPVKCILNPKVDSNTAYWLKASWDGMVSKDSAGYQKMKQLIERKNAVSPVVEIRPRASSVLSKSRESISSSNEVDFVRSNVAELVENGSGEVSPLSMLMEMFHKNVMKQQPQTAYYLDKLKLSKKAHMFSALMKFIIKSAEHLGSEETKDAIRSLARSHVNYGVDSATLNTFFVIIPDMLNAVLGEDYPHLDEIVDAWNNAFSAVAIVWVEELGNIPEKKLIPANP